MKIIIGWLYFDLMNTYGDRGNVMAINNRCERRKINHEIRELSVGFSGKELNECDLILMGGAEDRQQEIVTRDFTKEKKKVIEDMISRGIPGLYICGAFQFLGEYYKTADGKDLACLGILPFYTEQPDETSRRLIGNIIVDLRKGPLESLINADTKPMLIGFENHGGRTYLNDPKMALGKTIKGFGNNGKDGTEGLVYKNTIGTYLHGPMLPRNPFVADFLIAKALELKYNQKIELDSLDDELENINRNYLHEKIQNSNSR